MANDLSAGSLLSIAKERWSDIFTEVVYKKSPFLAEVKKDGTKISGKYLVQPLLIGHNNAVSASISQAVTASAAASELPVAFQIPRVKLYNAAKIDGETMLALTGGDSSAADVTEAALDGAGKAVAEKLGQQLMRSGWGTKGSVLTGSISGSTIKLSNPEDIWGWERNDVVCFSSTEATAVLRGAAPNNQLTVSKVDRRTALITFTAAVSTVTGGGGSVANADTIFDFGNRQDSATPSPLCVAGLGLWSPDTTPTTTLFNVDRTLDSRTYGLYYDASAQPIEEGIVSALAYAGREGAMPDRLYVNPTQYGQLQNALGVRARYVDVRAKDVNVGFKGITFTGNGGECVVMSDPSTPVSRGFAVDMDTFCLYYLGNELVHIYEDDGKQFQRDNSGNSDAVSVWFRFLGNLGCSAPPKNLQIKFA